MFGPDPGLTVSVILSNTFTPLFAKHTRAHIQVFQRARLVIGVTTLVQILVTPPISGIL